MIGALLLVLALAACGTVTGAAVGAGGGAAVGYGTGYGAGKGALIGTGVGAAAGAIYDIHLQLQEELKTPAMPIRLSAGLAIGSMLWTGAALGQGTTPPCDEPGKAQTPERIAGEVA